MFWAAVRERFTYQTLMSQMGILFATYSTLRSQKNNKSRLKQIVDWAGVDFEGAIAYDECHSMGNAMQWLLRVNLV
nr:strawberry notch family protein [Nostoc sp. DedQUE03]MDZ7974095.1 strawberry notch family protein [Nostoc sp. DedQUE03]MDZ8047596.1 strawberry notch family protein [Nostoc sp. DedQUE02]